MTQVMNKPTLFLAPGNARALARGAETAEGRPSRPTRPFPQAGESSPAPTFPARAEPPGARARIVLKPKAVKRTRTARTLAAVDPPRTEVSNPLAAVRRHLEAAFLGRAVCLLTHSERICGTLASLGDRDCLILGGSGERRIPLRDILGAAQQGAAQQGVAQQGAAQQGIARHGAARMGTAHQPGETS